MMAAQALEQAVSNIRPRVVYARQYNIGLFGLERLHPFDSRKYGRAYRELPRAPGARELRHRTLRPEAPVSREQLLRFHTTEYLEALRRPEYLAGALEVPPLRRLPARFTDLFVLRAMRWATAGI